MSKAARRTEREIPDALRNFDSLPDSAEVRLPVVCGFYGDVSPMTIYRWEKAGLIPKRKKRGLRVTTWNVGELRRSRAAADAGASS